MAALGKPPRIFRPVRSCQTHPDRWNLGVLGALCLALGLLLPPAHGFAVMDDGLYAQAVGYYQATGAYLAHDWAAASLVAQVVWGAFFADLFGFSTTVLTWSTLVLAGAGIFLCYWLLRLVRVPPPQALFGALLVLANPVYLHLSYSFMTDVPALTWSLAAICFTQWGLQTGRDRRLLVGMLFCVLGSFQIWQSISGSGAVPDQYLAMPGEPAGGLLVLGAHAGLALVRLLLVAPAIALWILPLSPSVWRVRMSAKMLMTVAEVAFILAAAYWIVDGPGRTPFDQTRGVFDSTGFSILSGDPSTVPQILDPMFWLVRSLVLIGLTAWLGVYWGSRLLWRLRALVAARFAAPVSFLACAGCCALAITIITPRMYDRYLLMLLPFVLVVLLPPFVRAPARLAAYGLWGLLFAFSVVCQADFQVGQPARFAYAVTERPLDGYRIIGQIPYFSRLGGATWRSVLLEQRVAAH